MRKIMPLILLLVLALFATPAIAEDALSDNWLDYSFSVNDVTGTLPMPVSTFLDEGWTLEDPEDTLEPEQYALSRRLTKDDAMVYVQVINLSINELPVTECLIGTITLDDYDAKKGGTLTVAGGITLGDTTEAVEAAFGTPGDTYEGSSSTTYTYESASYCHTKFTFDVETGLVTKIEIRNFTTPDGYNDEALAAPVETPQAVLDYAPPTELGDDLLSFNVRIGDVLYSLPASYEYMESQGWQLGQKQDGKIAAWSYRRSVPLVLGGFSVNTQLYNASPTATTPENCFIPSLRLEASSKLDVELPGGITFGMSGEALLAALDAQPYEYTINEGSSYISYNIKEAVLQDINIKVNLETDEVDMIELSNQP